MPLLWLRVAMIFYAVGLAHAFFSLARRHELLNRIVMPSILVGALFHLVSLVELTVATGHLTPTTVHHSESLLAFLVIAFFLVFWLRYKTASPGVFIFPLVFLLTLAASIGEQSPELSSPLLRTSWIFAHVTLTFLGYAALMLSFVASLLYLVQERRLKSKSPKVWRMPALEVIDEIGYKSLLAGFPLMTLGLVAGAVVAQLQFGAAFFRDPKVVLALLVWLVYLVLLFTRWSAGWRGRRAAVLATVAFVAAMTTWAANYFSVTHRYLGP
jgi:ABC-type uncharacterized transport system permease subunit